MFVLYNISVLPKNEPYIDPTAYCQGTGRFKRAVWRSDFSMETHLRHARYEVIAKLVVEKVTGPFLFISKACFVKGRTIE